MLHIWPDVHCEQVSPPLPHDSIDNPVLHKPSMLLQQPSQLLFWHLIGPLGTFPHDGKMAKVAPIASPAINAWMVFLRIVVLCSVKGGSPLEKG